MSVDSNLNSQSSLDMIIGPMYSGKSTELIRRLNIFAEMGIKVLYVNSKIDNRTDENFSTHSSVIKSIGKIDSIKVDKLSEIDFDLYQIIGIDEAQFFDNLKDCIIDLVEKRHKKVIVTGLNGDYLRRPFGEVNDLIPICDNVTKLNPFCKMCIETNNTVRNALFTKRIVCNTTDTVLVGSNNLYIPACRECYFK